MTRFSPYSLLTASLFFMWLVLGESYSPGRVLFGAVIAVGGVWITMALRLDGPRLRRPRAVLHLARHVSADIVRSNIAVARIIMRRNRRRTSNFMTIPLDLRDPGGLATLACILTATPGTIWMNYDRNSGVLLLHVLDLIDEETWIRLIKDRYERLLMEIFE